jgi:DNA modification methylase
MIVRMNKTAKRVRKDVGKAKVVLFDTETKASAEAKPAYKTKRGVMFRGVAENVLSSRRAKKLQGKVQLIFTSPPFPLNRKKKYGNVRGDAYLKWLAGFAPIFKKLLKKDGSIVIEMGNAWESGSPVMSPLALKALLAFLEAGKFNLCQQFVCYNPARLPSPAQWVNVERIRVKDSYTHVWWMSTTKRPKADNRKVLKPYSAAMLELLSTKKYNAGHRPSEHKIGKKSFFKNNNGAIPSNVLLEDEQISNNLLKLSNTASTDPYLRFCRDRELVPHPARMPIGLPEFFIKFLTDSRDLVLDPFAGSNTTGAAAEHLKRRWISVEAQPDYIAASKGRFPQFSKRKKKSRTKRNSAKAA